MERSRPTLLDVAHAAGVSRSTASRVINDQPRVAPEVREHVRRVIEELGYRPDSSARALASGRAEVLDLVVIECDAKSFSANPFYGRVVTGAVTALAGTDVHLRVHIIHQPELERTVDDISARGTLGALLVNVHADQAERLHRRLPRIVSLGRSAPGVPFTVPDNSGGAAMAVAHLMTTGRHRIAAIDGLLCAPCAQERHAGFEGAMREAGLPPVSVAGNYTREGGLAATRQLLAAEPDLDAIFAACDLTAAGVLQALVEAGRRVPDDVAVVGFDGSILSACSNPPLSSVFQPVEEMTAHAARELLHGNVEKLWQAHFPVALTVRESSAA